MPEQNYSIETDLSEAQAMAQALTPYVYEEPLYGNIGNMPSLTLGSLLMRLRRLRALENQLTPAQRMRLSQIEAQHESVLRDWRTHYDAKLLKEVDSRLDDMKPFFSECREDPRACAGAYVPEAFRRTIIQEIIVTIENFDMNETNLASKLRRSDLELQRYIKTCPFIWSAILQPVYPPDTFWWLYNRPPAGK